MVNMPMSNGQVMTTTLANLAHQYAAHNNGIITYYSPIMPITNNITNKQQSKSSFFFGYNQ